MSNAYNSHFHTPFDIEVGSLSWDGSTRTGGKKVLQWTFRAVGSRDVVPVAVSVETYKGGLRFKASCEKLTGDFADSDINSLHRRVEAALADQAASLSGIEWTDWFEVIVRGSCTLNHNNAFSGRITGAN